VSTHIADIAAVAHQQIEHRVQRAEARRIARGASASTAPGSAA